jgi:hypothetical protein
VVSKTSSKPNRNFDTVSQTKSTSSKQKLIEKINKMSEDELMKLIGDKIDLNGAEAAPQGN